MRSHFIRLFYYDHYASLRLAAMIVPGDKCPKAEQIMAHLLCAQQVWLGRCINHPFIPMTLWPEWKAEDFGEMIDSNHRQWISFLEGLNERDFDQSIAYKNLQGESFENKLVDLLTQVINHGTHHRAQAGQHLKSAGNELPNTDYIGFIRQL